MGFSMEGQICGSLKCTQTAILEVAFGLIRCIRLSAFISANYKRSTASLMSSSEDKDGSKTPEPPDKLDFGPDQSHPQGSAGSDQQHNPDLNPSTLVMS